MGIKVSTSVRLGTPASGAIYAQMLAGATKPISIRSIVLVQRTATGGEIGLARSFSVGTASAGNVATGIAHRAPRQPDVVGSVEIGWSTSPTGPTGVNAYFKREALNGVTGTRFHLLSETESPIVIEPTGATGMGLLLVNVGSAVGAALDAHITWEFGPASDN